MFNLNSKNTSEVENSMRTGRLLTLLMAYIFNQNKGRMKKEIQMLQFSSQSGPRQARSSNRESPGNDG